MRNIFTFTMGSVLALAAAASAARAAERVTLRNGFEMQCTHHAEVEGRVRLFSGKSEESYIEFGRDEIAGFEQVPDPPELAKPAAALPIVDDTTPQSLAVGRVNTTDARLSPDDLREILAKAGREHHLDVDLLASLVKAESGGNARAVSRAGARGLMQLMPATAASLGVQDSFEPEQNVRGGTAYLDALLTYYKDNLALALAAYNAGPGAVAKYHGIPPYYETRVYVARVIHEFNRRVNARRAQAKLAIAASATFPSPSSR
jgi:soluble lytic murein transglycosylase-like protein